MTYLPAPYESPQQDDLSATLCAILTTTVGLITSWVIGQHAYPVLKEYINGAMGNLSSAQEDALTAAVDTVLMPAVGWAVAAVLMVIGSLLLLFRRGRGLLIFGALLASATTAWAQFGLGYGGEDAAIPVSQWPLYWGGVAVVVLALLPATKRWLGRNPKTTAQSTIIGTTESGAILWPGM